MIAFYIVTDPDGLGNHDVAEELSHGSQHETYESAQRVAELRKPHAKVFRVAEVPLNPPPKVPRKVEWVNPHPPGSR